MRESVPKKLRTDIARLGARRLSAARRIGRQTLLIVVVGLVMWLGAGYVFYLLEPSLHSWSEGVWLAFTTAATVGYGDYIPTTPAARAFAVLTVLVGLAFLSTVTAGIAALLVGETEQRVERQMHEQLSRIEARLVGIEQQLAAQAPGRLPPCDPAGAADRADPEDLPHLQRPSIR
jgi:voltage-gated potassium channel